MNEIPRPVPTRQLFWLAAVGVGTVISLAAIGAASYVSAVRRVDHTLDVRENVDEWMTAVLDAETGVRGYLLAKRTSFLEPYESAVRRERAQAALLRGLVADNPAQTQNVAVADRDAGRVMDRLREIVALADAGRRDDAGALVTAPDSKQR